MCKIKPKIINYDFLLIPRSVRNEKQGCCSRVNVILNPYLAQEKYKRKPQLGKAPSIPSKCACLSCGVLIIIISSWIWPIRLLIQPRVQIPLFFGFELWDLGLGLGLVNTGLIILKLYSICLLKKRRMGWKIWGALRQVAAAFYPAQAGQLCECLSLPLHRGRKKKDSSDSIRKQIYSRKLQWYFCV